MRIGAHMSVAGGLTRAVDRAVRHECEALQIFTKNNARWAGRPIDPEQARGFRDAVAAAGLHPVVSHASYLINLAAPPGALREKSIDAMVDELDRAHALGLQAVVVHPGVAAAGMSEDDALALVAAAVQTALTRQPTRETLLLLEHTAGPGRSIGYRFEHLAAIIAQTADSSRIGICLDTCHLLASGYDISSAAGYSATFEAFERQVGMRRLRLFHANDSKRACGSRLDRHEHIGQGFVGSEAFGRILNDPRFDNLAMVIETHKTPGVCDHPTRTNVDPLDAMNLDALRSLRVGRSLPLQSPQ